MPVFLQLYESYLDRNDLRMHNAPLTFRILNVILCIYTLNGGTQ